MRKSVFITLLIACILAGCGQRKESEKQEITDFCHSTIDSIIVKYKNYVQFEYIAIDRCEKLLNEKSRFWDAKEEIFLEDGRKKIKLRGIIDTCVIDCETRVKIEECLETTKPGNYLAFEDACMVAIVYFKDGTQSTLCVCGPLSKDIYRDGVLIEENYRLLYLIKLYSGYYSWFDKEERGMMLELWDSEWSEPITMTAETNPQIKIVNVEN